MKSAVWASICRCQGDVPIGKSAPNIAVVRADSRGSLERSRNTVVRLSNVRALHRPVESDEHECAKLSGTTLLEPSGPLASIAFEITRRRGAASGLDPPTARDAADRPKLNAPRFDRESVDALRILKWDTSDRQQISAWMVDGRCTDRQQRQGEQNLHPRNLSERPLSGKRSDSRSGWFCTFWYDPTFSRGIEF